MKDDVLKLRQEISDLHKQMQQSFKKAEEVRKFYKYQNQELDSISESFIINFSNSIGDFYGVICDLDELLEENDELFYEEEE